MKTSSLQMPGGQKLTTPPEHLGLTLLSIATGLRQAIFIRSRPIVVGIHPEQMEVLGRDTGRTETTTGPREKLWRSTTDKF